MRWRGPSKTELEAAEERGRAFALNVQGCASLSSYVKQEQLYEGPIRLVQNNELPCLVPPADPSARGVWEAEYPPPGWTVLNVVASDGPLMEVRVRSENATPTFVEKLWRYLDREDPPFTLRVVS